jgi:cytochrome c553
MAALLGIAGAQAATPPPIAEGCLTCHGEAGVSQTENIPSVAGQPTLFTQWQLVFYRLGRIKNEVMNPIAEELSDDDVRQLGTYLASLPPPKPSEQPDDAPALTATGKKLVQENHCDNCHGAQLAGQQAAARLAGQREEYLLKAFHDYKTGVRSGTGPAKMPEVIYALKEDDLKALAHYLSRLP